MRLVNCCLLMLAFCGLLLVYGLQLGVGEHRAVLRRPSSGRWAWVYLCIPIGAALMIVEILGDPARRLFRGRPLPAPPVQEMVE